MKKKKLFQVTNRSMLIIMTIICISVIALTATEVISIAPIQKAAATVIVPFQKGINAIGGWFADSADTLRSKSELLERVNELESEIAQLKEQNVLDEEDRGELKRLRELYNIDNEYSSYEKVEANVISKDAGNWYSKFIIDKGFNDGIETDMNVISGGGLVGIVTEVGPDWASIKSIIDDSSSVSAMTLTTGDTCIVNGDLRLIDEGKLAFDQLRTDDSILPGERVVTSYISDKFLPGISIGTITEISDDSNHLTKTGYILPSVDFAHVREVLVIKQLKQNVEKTDAVDQ